MGMIGISWFLLQAGPVAKPQVLFFVNHDCPIARRYSPEFNRLVNEFGKTFDFRSVYCDQGVPLETLKKFHSEFKLITTFSFDSNRKLVRAYGVKVVPTAVILNRDQKVWYFGRIDNAYGDNFKWRKPTQFELRDALRSIRAGTLPKTIRTSAIGCTLADL